MPSGTQAHVGVYDLSERQHNQLLRRRGDLVSLLMYLTERRISSHQSRLLKRDRKARGGGLRMVPGIFSGGGSAEQHDARKRERIRSAPGQTLEQNFDWWKRRARPALCWNSLHRGAWRTGTKRNSSLGCATGSHAWPESPAVFESSLATCFLIAGEMMREKSWTACWPPGRPDSGDHLLELLP